MESSDDPANQNTIPIKKSNLGHLILLVINYFSLFVGSVSSSLLSRFYFVHGGSNRWVSTWVQSAGFPILFIPIYLSSRTSRPFSLFTPKLLMASLLIGLLLGVNNFCIAWGVSYLPVSTSSLTLSSQLAFNLILSMLIVKQKVNLTNLNCVVLLTLGSVLLALGSSHDRPPGVSGSQFFLGFLSILAAALMFALYLPLVEMIYRDVLNYNTVMEMQVLMEAMATLFATVGMLCVGGFGKMKIESEKDFNLGISSYWLVVGFNIITWQLCFMGTAGVVYLTSSLNGGICMTALLPVNVIAGVLAFGDNFGGYKIVSMVLSIWGFCSYLYGEFKMKKKIGKSEKEMEIAVRVNGDAAAIV